MRKYIILILCLSLLNSGCATLGIRPNSTSDYKLRVGDELRIVIWDKLDEKVIIRPDYKISLPLIGEIDCKHKTPKALSDELSKQYQTKTVVIVTKYHTWKDEFKGAVGFLRDSAIVYFIGERITETED
jgi:protein involved in polysaccharide export with SLBB domain